MKTLTALLIVLVFAALYWSYTTYWIYTEVIINGESYNVLNGDREAASKLANIHETLLAFLGRLKKKYRVDMTKEELAAFAGPVAGAHAPIAGHSPESIVKAILFSFNPEKVYENDPNNLSGSTSYTVQKGREMFVCMRNKDGSFVEKNTMLFVLLHEISHIGAYWTFGHTADFWATFSFILEEAIADGTYKYVNYAESPANYCGMIIKNTPYNP